MTEARKTKPASSRPSRNPAKPKLEVVSPSTPKTKSKNPRRRKGRKGRKKNKGMSTGAKIAIAAGVVLVGIPLVLFTVGAIGVGIVAKKGFDDVNNRPIPTPTPTPQPTMDFYPAPM